MTPIDVTNLADVRDAQAFSAKAATMTDAQLGDALIADTRIIVDLFPYLDGRIAARAMRIMQSTIAAAGIDVAEVGREMERLLGRPWVLGPDSWPRPSP